MVVFGVVLLVVVGLLLFCLSLAFILKYVLFGNDDLVLVCAGLVFRMVGNENC